MGAAPAANRNQPRSASTADILDAFRSAGPKWQTRINAALRDWLEKHPQA
ncbi:MAG: BrnA antitoxin family protein [Pseudomonadota bacterium]